MGQERIKMYFKRIAFFVDSYQSNSDKGVINFSYRKATPYIKLY